MVHQLRKNALSFLSQLEIFNSLSQRYCGFKPGSPHIMVQFSWILLTSKPKSCRIFWILRFHLHHTTKFCIVWSINWPARFWGFLRYPTFPPARSFVEVHCDRVSAQSSCENTHFESLPEGSLRSPGFFIGFETAKKPNETAKKPDKTAKKKSGKICWNWNGEKNWKRRYFNQPAIIIAVSDFEQ